MCRSVLSMNAQNLRQRRRKAGRENWRKFRRSRDKFQNSSYDTRAVKEWSGAQQTRAREGTRFFFLLSPRIYDVKFNPNPQQVKICLLFFFIYYLRVWQNSTALTRDAPSCHFAIYSVARSPRLRRLWSMIYRINCGKRCSRELNTHRQNTHKKINSCNFLILSFK